MDARARFENTAAARGWTPQTQVAVLLNFLESADMPEGTERNLGQFLDEVTAREENPYGEVSRRKFFRTEFKLIIFSEGESVDGLTIEELAYEVAEGDCAGELVMVEARELTPKECAEALIAQGSLPEFFQLDKEGNEVVA